MPWAHPDAEAVPNIAEAAKGHRPPIAGPWPRAKATVPDPASAEKRIATLLSKFGPEQQELIRAVRKALQQRFPTANEPVYDYAQALWLADLIIPPKRGPDRGLCTTYI